jgi:hypothetical protein
MLLTEIATQYADDYYFYRLIENPLVLQKQLIAAPASGLARSAGLTERRCITSALISCTTSRHCPEVLSNRCVHNSASTHAQAAEEARRASL